MYIKDNKYRKENNNFNFKFIIFYNFYNKADIPQKAKVKAYPIMLYSLVFDHYYINLKNITLTLLFNYICNIIHNYFKGPEYRYNILG